jgi:hypothetical protein
MKPLRLALLLVIACAVACGGVTHNLSRKEAIRPSQVKGILIMGVSPAHHLQINVGTNVSNAIWQRDASPAAADVAPEDGYIVIDLDATTAITEYGITLVAPIDSDYVYWACPDRRTIAFQVPPNRAAYVGDVHFETKSNAIGTQLSFDAERARRFVERRYPALLADFRVVKAHVKDVAFPDAPEAVSMKCLDVK